MKTGKEVAQNMENIKTVKIPTHLSQQELMSLIESIEAAFGCELTRVYPDKVTFAIYG